jgi:hypothetical protein
MPVPEKWHDYSEADAVVAVRPCDRFHKESRDYSFTNRKPASKLLNAWTAGAPAILSPDSEFEDLQRSELDYLEARSVPEIVSQLVRLKADPALRKAMADNGKRRAEELSLEQRIGSWIGIISNQVVPEYLRWQKSPLRRQFFYLTRIMMYKMKEIDRDFWEIYAQIRDRVRT